MTPLTVSKIVKKYKVNEDDLNEIMQPKSMRFAFAYTKGDTLVQCMPTVKCRDFLKEQILFTYYGKKLAIYGFNTAENTPNTKEYTGFLINLPIQSEKDYFEKNFHILTEYEKSLGFTQLSEVYKVEGVNNNNLYFVKGDAIWQQSVLMVSFYSLMLRTLCCDLKDSFTSITQGKDRNLHDATAWKSMDGFAKIRHRDQLLDLIAKEDYKDLDVNSVHNYTGAYYMLSTQNCVMSFQRDLPVWVGNWK